MGAAMVLLYWDIGRVILQRQTVEGWGAKTIDRLSSDLRAAFPDMKGLSPRTLKYMRAFAEAWPDREFVQQLAAQIPWFHNCLLLERIQDAAVREWYIGAIQTTSRLSACFYAAPRPGWWSNTRYAT